MAGSAVQQIRATSLRSRRPVERTQERPRGAGAGGAGTVRLPVSIKPRRASRPPPQRRSGGGHGRRRAGARSRCVPCEARDTPPALQTADVDDECGRRKREDRCLHVLGKRARPSVRRKPRSASARRLMLPTFTVLAKREEQASPQSPGRQQCSRRRRPAWSGTHLPLPGRGRNPFEDIS